jgi:hypothetical protein
MKSTLKLGYGLNYSLQKLPTKGRVGTLVSGQGDPTDVKGGDPACHADGEFQALP